MPPRRSSAHAALRRFAADLRQFIDSPAAIHLLDAYEGTAHGTYFTGGCAALAEALSRTFPRSITYGVFDGRGQLHHVLVRVENLYLDANGLQTAAEVVDYWEEEEGIAAPARLRPLDREKLDGTLLEAGIPCPAGLVGALRARLRVMWSGAQRRSVDEISETEGVLS